MFFCRLKEEALSVSKAMNAKWTVLTHFSARYGQICHIDEVNEKNVNISFDFMYLNSKNINMLNDVNHLLKLVFKENIDFNEKRKNFLESKNVILKE